jgi:hypothetical protein
LDEGAGSGDLKKMTERWFKDGSWLKELPKTATPDADRSTIGRGRGVRFPASLSCKPSWKSARTANPEHASRNANAKTRNFLIYTFS